MTLSEYLTTNNPIIDEDFFYKFAHEKIFFPLGPNNASYVDLGYNDPEVLRRIPIRETEGGTIAVFMASNKSIMLTRPYVAIPLIFAVESVCRSDKYNAMLLYTNGSKTVVATKPFLQDVLDSRTTKPIPQKAFALNEYLIQQYEKKEKLDQKVLFEFRDTKIFCSVISDGSGQTGQVKEGQKVTLFSVQDSSGIYLMFYTDKNDRRLAGKIVEMPLFGVAQLVLDNKKVQGLVIHSDQKAWCKLGETELQTLLKSNFI